MPEIDEATLLALHDELTKIAAPSWGAVKGVLGRMAGPGSAGMGVGGLLGAGAGAIRGGFRGAAEAREQGDSVLSGALGGAARGVGKGALIGATAGGALGAAAGAAGAKGVGEALTQAPGMLGSAGRFGQRQLHGLTGWTPEAGLRSIRGGSFDAAQRVAKAQQGVIAEGSSSKAVKELASAGEGLKAMEQAERMGLTSIPGYLKSLKEHGVGKTLRAGFDSQLKGTGRLNKALMVGLPAASVASEVARPDEAGAPGKFEPAGRAAAGLLYAAAPLPLVGQLVAGSALSKGLGGAGKAIDKLRRRNSPAPATLEPATGSEPVEHIYTDRAAGRVPETLQ